MMLTDGIELAEGKSNLDGGGAAPFEAAAIPGATPVVVVNGGGAGKDEDGADASAAVPEPLGCQANACAPSEASKARAFMLATTREGSRSRRSSAQSAPLQPRVVRT